MRLRDCVWIVSAGLMLYGGTVQSEVAECGALRDGRGEAVYLDRGERDPDGMRVGAVLKIPAGPGPHPAMVVLHGSGGLRAPRCYEGALDLLVGWGYAALAVDSQSGRFAQGGYNFGDQAADAVRAHRLLAGRPDIDGSRIGVIGWSKGGLATLAAVTAVVGADGNDGDSVFSAAVVFYPQCIAQPVRLKSNLLVLIGEEDRDTPVRLCREMAVERANFSYELKIYPGAGHVFDAPWHHNYNESAARDAIARTEVFLARHLEALP